MGSSYNKESVNQNFLLVYTPHCQHFCFLFLKSSPQNNKQPQFSIYLCLLTTHSPENLRRERNYKIGSVCISDDTERHLKTGLQIHKLAEPFYKQKNQYCYDRF